MDEQEIASLLKLVRSGDELSREKLIRHFTSFVINVASRVTKKYVSWSDEESSIALSALNKAIDHYSEDNGKKFINFCYLLISRDLIDYYRREQKHQHISLDEQLQTADDFDPAEVSYYESVEAEKQYSLQEERAQLVQEILIYESALKNYGIRFQELPEVSPKHQDTRDNCFRLAQVLAANDELITLMKKKKKLPIKELSRISEVPSKTIEKNRKYIIAVTICLLHPDLERIRRFIERGGSSQ